MRAGIWLCWVVLQLAGCVADRCPPGTVEREGFCRPEEMTDVTRAAMPERRPMSGSKPQTPVPVDEPEAAEMPGATADEPGPACTPSAPDSCGSACVNTRTDRDHCGGCDVTCEGFQICTEGKCSPRYAGGVVASGVPGGLWNMARTASGDMYFAGLFKGTLDFDPGPAEVTLTGRGTNDVFVSRYKADGTYAWTRGLSPELGADWVHATAAADGGVFVTGHFQGSMDSSRTWVAWRRPQQRRM